MPRKPRSLMNCPDLRRQVAVDVRGLPVVEHRAQLFAVVVEERLLLGA